MNELGGPQQLVEDVALVGILQQRALADDGIQVGVWGGLRVSLAGLGRVGQAGPLCTPAGAPQPSQTRASPACAGHKRCPGAPARLSSLPTVFVSTANKVCGIVFILYFMMPLFYQMSRKKGHVAAKPRRGGGQGIRHQTLGADTLQLQGTLPLLSALAIAGNTGMWAGGGGPGPGQSRTGV